MTLSAHDVSVIHKGRCVLECCSFDLGSGEVVALVGPNGAGKSTLLSVLSGDLEPSLGSVSLDGQPLSAFSLAELAERRAVVATPPQLAFDYTVTDVVTMGWLGSPEGALFDTALAAVLEEGELTALAGRKYTSLSSGERQRAEYARGQMQIWRSADDSKPRWFLLDEPTANLDVAHGITMLEALRRRSRLGDGVLVVLHDLDLAARFADRIVLLAEGKMTAEGPPAAVMTTDRLSETYRAPIHVEQHTGLNRLVVIG